MPKFTAHGFFVNCNKVLPLFTGEQNISNSQKSQIVHRKNSFLIEYQIDFV